MRPAQTSELERILAQGKAIHAGVTAPDDAIAKLVSERLADEEHPSALDADELYLACACALGDRVALATFEQRYFAVVPAALSRLSLGRDEIAEVEQLLRVRLFVPPQGADADPADDAPGSSARVVAYAGHGRLGGLVRVAAVRAGLNLLRDRGRLHGDASDGLEDVPISGDDPELARLKAQHRAAFKAAFEEAVAMLEPRERSLLGLAIVRGLGIDRIGAIYGVHRATAARWVAAARANLTRAVHRTLAARLGVRDATAEALLPLVESQLELSLDRLLRSRAEASAD